MARETGEVFLFLLDLAHPSMETMHFVNDKVDLVVGLVTYTAFPFDVVLPDDREDEITRIQLAIDNIDLHVVEAVRSIDTPATVTLSLVRAAEPTVLLAGPVNCSLRNVVVNELTVSGDLAPWEDMMNEPYPKDVFDPARFPALFR
jgi:hypothetical protein